jgi:hypothetical protein
MEREIAMCNIKSLNDSQQFYEHHAKLLDSYEPLRRFSESHLYKIYHKAILRGNETPFPKTFTVAHRDAYMRMKFKVLH